MLETAVAELKKASLPLAAGQRMCWSRPKQAGHAPLGRGKTGRHQFSRSDRWDSLERRSPASLPRSAAVQSCL